MDILILRKLKIYFSEEGNALFLGKPASDSIISAAEANLNVQFDKDYIRFIKLFGGSFVGMPIHGFNNSEMLSEQTVIDLTKEFRDAYKEDNRCPIIQTSYVISIEGNGDPVMITPTGEVLVYYHDNDETEVIADSFEQLVEANLG